MAHDLISLSIIALVAFAAPVIAQAIPRKPVPETVLLLAMGAVLGAFAAGFVLRFIIPEGNVSLEAKLDAIGFGFLIPIFFVVSGAKIDLSAIAASPAMLVRFMVMLVAVRTVPIAISLRLGKTRSEYTAHERLSVALYCTTALPIIVAVTSICAKNGSTDSSTASIMVAAGALTVFIMPLLAQVAYSVADRHPIDAVREIAHNPHDFGHIVSEHIHEHREHHHTDYHLIHLPKRRYDVAEMPPDEVPRKQR